MYAWIKNFRALAYHRILFNHNAGKGIDFILRHELYIDYLDKTFNSHSFLHIYIKLLDAHGRVYYKYAFGWEYYYALRLSLYFMATKHIFFHNFSFCTLLYFYFVCGRNWCLDLTHGSNTWSNT